MTKGLVRKSQAFLNACISGRSTLMPQRKTKIFRVYTDPIDMNEKSYNITREKHLDHMVRVVPLIVLVYAIQCYVLSNMEGPIGVKMLWAIGGLLITMIVGFVSYDVYHQVTLFDEHLEITYYRFKMAIPFEDIVAVYITDPNESFGTVKVQTRKTNYRFYFVDDVAKIKSWIEEHQKVVPLAA